MEDFWDSNGRPVSKIIETAIETFVVYTPSVNGDTCASGGDDANGVTVWLTTQSYNRIPLMIRKVANGIIAFKLKNVKEIMSIYDEFVIGLSKDQFMDILKYVFKKNYDFLFMNFDKPWDEVYHKNFNQLVLDV